MSFGEFNAVFRDAWQQIVALRPAFLSKKPHFNFITIHYFWIIGLAVVGSILLYPAGQLAYIDALFFASGACTQAGLNTVDVNSLNTYQQMVLFFLPYLTNPISINTFVVFLRLYWFEKRFQHIAKEAKRKRGTLSKSRSEMKKERDIENEEKGVNGRPIVVMHSATHAYGQTNDYAVEDDDEIHETKPAHEQDVNGGGRFEKNSKDGSTSAYDLEHDGAAAPQSPQIKFAEQVKRSDAMKDEPLLMPMHWTDQDHIAVLERQRNQSTKDILRIPGPRDAERGMAPETLEEEEAERRRISRRDSSLDGRRHSLSAVPPEAFIRDHRTMTDDQGPRRAIVIDETNKPVHEDAEERARAAAHTLGIFKLRIPRVFTGSKTHEEGHSGPGTRPRSRANSFSNFRATGTKDKDDMTPYLSWQPTIGRNSAFVDLTEEQREELGGIEYRSLKTLALILTLYYWGFTLFGFISLIPWIYKTEPWGSVVDAAGQNRAWWGFFTTSTAFNDVGFTLTPDSMISFQTAVWPLLLMSFLIVIGNTGFPVMLRFIIWVTTKYIPAGSGLWEELQFLLDHPRRCFTLLFPGKATWWLFWILVILNGIDLLFFVILDLGNTVVSQLPGNIKVLDGWFQAVSTRTAGTACVNLSDLHPGIQASYMIMMYISVLPIAISVRRTNVYEEQSLGLYGSADEGEDGEPSYVGAHLRRQLSFDLWYIFLGFFIITIAEGTRLQSGDSAFTMFAVLFEVISAYGTVGLSLGYTGINASLSAEFGVVSKLVIISMQIRGRHRGLPYELDRAILLPSESMHEKEDHEAAVRLRRRNSVGTTSGTATGLDPHHNSSSERASDQGRARQRKAPSLLSRLMHIGPVVSRESHEAEQRPQSSGA